MPDLSSSISDAGDRRHVGDVGRAQAPIPTRAELRRPRVPEGRHVAGMVRVGAGVSSMATAPSSRESPPP